MSTPSLRPAGRLAQAYQDVAGAVVPGPLPGTHLAAAALGTDQRLVTVGVQRGLPASAPEGARLAQWQAEVPCEPHIPVCPPDVVVRVVRVVVAVLLPVADVADEPRVDATRVLVRTRVLLDYSSTRVRSRVYYSRVYLGSIILEYSSTRTCTLCTSTRVRVQLLNYLRSTSRTCTHVHER